MRLLLWFRRGALTARFGEPKTNFQRRGFQVLSTLTAVHGLANNSMKRSSTHAVAKYLVQITIVFLAYFIAGKLGQATTNIRSNNLGPVWPAYGVALAAVLLPGYRGSSGIAVGAS